MKKNLCATLLALILNGCSPLFFNDPPPNTPENVFNLFVQQIEQNYSGKDVRAVNWDSLVRVYRPKISTQTTDNQLIETMSAMILPFGDYHLTYATPIRRYIPAADFDFPKPDSLPNFINDIAVANGLKTNLETYERLFTYAKTGSNIGYIKIPTFNVNLSPDYFDTILEQLKDTKGLIIDVRQNSGGQAGLAAMMAGRLVKTTEIYTYERTKIGPGKTDYSDFLSFTLKPSGEWQYNKPIVVLTSEYTYSAAIAFVLMLRTQAHITTLGTATGDGLTKGVDRELPNGWRLQVPSELGYLPDKTVVEGSGGVKPKIAVMISAKDRKNEIDTILNSALELLK